MVGGMPNRRPNRRSMRVSERACREKEGYYAPCYGPGDSPSEAAREYAPGGKLQRRTREALFELVSLIKAVVEALHKGLSALYDDDEMVEFGL